MKTSKPITLIIFDGWGYREEKEYNAIAQAHTPNFDRLWQTCPHSLLEGSGNYVGLPKGQMGNSEVGHLNLGAGRIVQQDFTRIEQAIKDGDFFENDALVHAVDQAIKNNKIVHIMGLLSPGGVHSHENQIHAAIKLAAKRGAKKIALHAFLDGRDTPPKSAIDSLIKIDTLFQQLNCGKIASLIGRYFAMDRDQRWERVEQAYNLLSLGKAYRTAGKAEEGLTAAYADGETDEFVKATSIHAENEEATTINDGDAVVFMNYRADRARQMTRAFIEKDFSGFKREKTPALSSFTCLTEYDANFNTSTAFQPNRLKNVLGEVLSAHHLTQLRIAETEKYAHVTFFFNGGNETPFDGEERELIPSPKVATYDLQPEMNASIVSEKLVSAVQAQKYDVIICNFANADMVGHTGDIDATIKAVECLDRCLGDIADALKETGGELLVTADHGNAEKMFNKKTGQAHTAHTSEPVPFFYMGRPAKIEEKGGTLSDISPTILYLLGIDIPKEMTGKSLIKFV